MSFGQVTGSVHDVAAIANASGSTRRFRGSFSPRSTAKRGPAPGIASDQSRTGAPAASLRTRSAPRTSGGGDAGATETARRHVAVRPHASSASNVTTVRPQGYASVASAPPGVRSLTTVAPQVLAMSTAGEAIATSPTPESAKITVAQSPPGVRAVSTGPARSMTVMVCEHVAELPHASVARHVRVSTSGSLSHPAPPLLVSGRHATSGGGQLSVAVTSFGSQGGTSPAQSKLAGPGQLTCGGVTSKTEILCVRTMSFPQESTALQVRTMTYSFAQFPGRMVSSNVIGSTPSQPSVAVGVAGGGMSSHSTEMSQMSLSIG